MRPTALAGQSTASTGITKVNLKHWSQTGLSVNSLQLTEVAYKCLECSCQYSKLESATFLKSGFLLRLNLKLWQGPHFCMATWIGISPFRRVSPHPHFIHSQYCSDRHYISNPCLNLFLNNLLGENTNIWPELTQRSMSCTWGSLPGPGTVQACRNVC